MAGKYAGIYRKLKDRRCSISDRLKLTRFAWLSDAVYIPNKQQVLIDFVTGLLVNRKRFQVSNEDAQQVWECLYALLSSKKACVVAKSAQTLLIKPSVAQVIVDTLQAAVTGTDVTTTDLVVGCCQAIVTSPALAYIFTSKYDILVHLLSVLSQLGTKQLLKGQELTLCSVLGHVINALAQSQRAHPNPKQVFQTTVDRLLGPCLSLWHLTAAGDGNLSSQDSLHAVHIGLMGILQSAFLNREHLASVTQYLKSVVVSGEEESRSHTQKWMDNLFTIFSELRQGKCPPKNFPPELPWPEIVGRYLTMFFKDAVELLGRDSVLCHKMFVHICRLLKLESGADGLQNEKPALSELAAMFEVIRDAELYDVAQDNAAGGVQLKFYRSMVDTLLGTSKEGALYNCLTTLIQLNHGILEPKMASVLQHVWFSRNETASEILPNLDCFLTELVKTYFKLRQFPKFIDFCLAAIKNCHEPVAVIFTSKLAKQWSEVVVQLPQMTMVDLWGRLLENLQSYQTDLQDEDNKDADGLLEQKLHAVSVLTYHFLLHIRVDHYSVTTLTTTKVQELMTTMESSLLKSMFLLGLDFKQKPDILQAALLLAYCWGELRIQLALHEKDRSKVHINSATVSHSTDMTLVLPFLKQKHWSKVKSRIQKFNSNIMLYLWDLLCVQKLKASVLFVPNGQDIGQSIQNTLDAFFPLLDNNEQKQNASWDGVILNIHDENYKVAKWQLLTRHYAHLARHLTSDQVCCIADEAVTSLSTCRKQDQDIRSHNREITCTSVTETFLQSAAVGRSGPLYSCLLSHIWRKIASTVAPKTSSKKRKKVDVDVAMVHDVLEKLGATDVSWHLSTDREVTDLISDVAAIVSQVLRQDLQIRVAVTKQQMDLVKVFQMIPVEYLRPADLLRCLFGLTLILTELAAGLLLGNVKNQEADVAVVMEMMMAILNSVGHVPVFQCLSPDSFLTCLLEMYTQLREHNYKNLSQQMELLLQSACQAVTRDSKALLGMASFVNKLAEQLQKSGDHLEKKKILKASERERAEFVLASHMLDGWNKVLRKRLMKDGAQQTCAEYFTTIAIVIDKVLTLMRNSPVKKTKVVPSAPLVRCMGTTVAWFSQSAGSSNLSMMENTSFVLNCVLEHLSHAKDFGDPDFQVYLWFIQTICYHDNHLATVLTPQVLDQIWSTLITLTTSMLVSGPTLTSLSTKLSSLKQPSVCKKRIPEGSQMPDEDTMDTSHSGDKVTLKQEVDIPKLEAILKELETSVKIAAAESVANSDPNVALVTKLQDGFDDSVHLDVADLIKKDGGDEDIAVTGGDVLDGSVFGLSDGILNSLQSTLATVISSFDLEQFRSIIKELIKNTSAASLFRDPKKLVSSIHIWQKLLQFQLPENHRKERVNAARHVVMNCQNVMLLLQEVMDAQIVLAVSVPVTKVQAAMLDLGHGFLSAQTAILCLHSCQFMPLEGLSYQCLFPAFHASYDVLNSLLVHHTKTVFRVIPSFLSAANRLLQAVLQYGCQDKLGTLPEYVEDMIGCAHLVTRLFTLLATHKVDFTKVTVYILAQYATGVQQVTLLPAVKRALVPGLYELLDICDKFSVAQLHTVLPQGVREVFKILYSDFTKYHKFSGKI